MRSKKAIYNIIGSLSLQIITIAYGFIVPKIIIENFGSNVNGLVASITQLLAYITLLESGVGPVVRSILYKPIAKKNKKEIENILKASEKFFRKIAYIFVIYIIFLSLIYPLIVNKDFDYLFTISMIVIISLSTFAEYFFGMTYRLYLKAEQQTYIISIIQILSYIISVIVIITLVKIGTNIQLIKLFSGLIFAMRPVFQNIYVKKKYKINLKNASDDYKIKNKFDGLAQHIAAVVHDNTDITILTIFRSLSEVSIYSIYSLVVKGIKSFLQSFSLGIESSFGDMLAKNEIENLNKRFNMYEVLYLSIATIICTTAMIIITPFVSVYTRGITDANYIRYTFGYLVVISELINAMRDPYITLAYAAGHFKETRNGAWVEAISNILISVLLVMKFGLIGVAIGTIVAMAIRTIEFIYHTNKYVLKRNINKSTAKIIVSIMEVTITIIIVRFIPLLNNISYTSLIINAIIIFALSTLVVCIFNIIFYKKEYKELIEILKNILKRKKA